MICILGTYIYIHTKMTDIYIYILCCIEFRLEIEQKHKCKEMVRHPHVSRCKALAALVDLGVPETRLMGQIWVIQEVTCARRSSHGLASSLFGMLKTIAIIGVSPIKPVWNHMVRKRRSKRKKIFLLPLGGGVFNNPFKEKWHWKKKLSDFMVVLIGFMLMKIGTAIECGNWMGTIRCWEKLTISACKNRRLRYFERQKRFA